MAPDPAKLTSGGSKDVPNTISIHSDFNLLDQNGKAVSLNHWSKKYSCWFFLYSLPRCLRHDERIHGQPAIGYAKNNLVYFASITVSSEARFSKALENIAKHLVHMVRMVIPDRRHCNGIPSCQTGFLVNALDEAMGISSILIRLCWSIRIKE